MAEISLQGDGRESVKQPVVEEMSMFHRHINVFIPCITWLF